MKLVIERQEYFIGKDSKFKAFLELSTETGRRYKIATGPDAKAAKAAAEEFLEGLLQLDETPAGERIVFPEDASTDLRVFAMLAPGVYFILRPSPDDPARCRFGSTFDNDGTVEGTLKRMRLHAHPPETLHGYLAADGREIVVSSKATHVDVQALGGTGNFELVHLQQEPNFLAVVRPGCPVVREINLVVRHAQ